jgi:hypothetical protein
MLSLMLLVPGRTVSICTGGACMSAGAANVLEACAILASADDSVSVLEKACCALCPRNGKVVVFDEDTSSVVPAAEPVAVANELIGGSDPTLADACVALSCARASPSVDAFDAVLGSEGGAIASLLESSAQAPLDPEPFIWEDSTWMVHDAALSVDSDTQLELSLAESMANFEFGSCGDLVLLDCADDGEGTLSGLYEGDGSGELSLSMREDGRRFDGTLSDDDGSEREWSGFRIEGVRGEAAPQRVAWLLEALVGRGRCFLEAGEASKALDDARMATRLCCRVGSGWLLRAEAAEACGQEEEARTARDEHEWLEWSA